MMGKINWPLQQRSCKQKVNRLGRMVFWGWLEKKRLWLNTQGYRGSFPNLLRHQLLDKLQRIRGLANSRILTLRGICRIVQRCNIICVAIHNELPVDHILLATTWHGRESPHGTSVLWICFNHNANSTTDVYLYDTIVQTIHNLRRDVTFISVVQMLLTV